MEFDAFVTGGLSRVGADAAAWERAGVGAVWAGEAGHDPTLLALSAAEATREVTIGTAILVAFARTPMTVAHAAWDLMERSGGRFVLGLGTQVRAHIERRYGMPWGKPVARMRDYIAALRAIFTTFQTGARLDYRGEFYEHTLMTPYFNPGPLRFETVPIALATVGRRMTELAGECADGVFLHPFTNTAYQDAVTRPALDEGIRRSGRSDRPWVFGYVFCIVGDTEEEQAASADQVRQQVAFYASTPTYRDVLAAIGAEDLQRDLQSLAKQGAWDRIGEPFTDDILEHFAVRGTLEEIPAQIRARYEGRLDRVASYFPLPDADPDRLADFVAAVRGDTQTL